MAEPQSNARLRADAGATTSGVIHVRTRLTADFTVISNALAQRRGSAVTVGVAAYISSLPDGSPVSIAALCRHFSEGEILISRALRELEEAGYLERRRERTSGGQVRTRTYFYDVPGGAVGDGPPEPPKPSRARKHAAAAAPTEEAVAAAPVPAKAKAKAEAEAEAEAAAAPIPLADADPRAVAVLTALRRVDPRLILSAQETARLAPAVTRWLAAGLLPTQITDHLTARLPEHFLTRPVGVLAYRLKETPLPVPTRGAEPPVRPAVVPMRNCDGCDRGFRAAEAGRCRDCRNRPAEGRLRAAG
ncbi:MULTISPECIES: winged helix DNA-binding protein [Streptomyces]|uniref:Helix-turn-helix domain-containing protein n=1 Tax=Streptomyces koelreuteriae TaxID=2838015 RepID=A0ABX8FSI7_9ACTN|nr:MULTISPECIES: winged helix DNA-binding protein [Streptomyces]QWB24097.1 hypothetical protein KJK29_16660 [Streptomyces koelreuteriae]UUA07083.1 MarR family transcriptional regulator [Streptomyces koelreuteriae]UUA14712.1 MarR family transcriptional regulator [Streptomyces sp. CRCS-T-1]